MKKYVLSEAVIKDYEEASDKHLLPNAPAIIKVGISGFKNFR